MTEQIRWLSNLALTPLEAVERYRPSLPSPLSQLPPALLLSFLLFSTFLVLTISTKLVSSTLVSPHAVKAGDSKVSKLRRNGTSTVLLVGPETTGKTSLFLSLTLGVVPPTHTSQRESERTLHLARRSTDIKLVDLPGHPRLRAKFNGYLSNVDGIVFCVDATAAVKGGSLAGQKSEALTEAVDHLHSVLTTLSRSRLSRNASLTRPPPSVLILFTRCDLSPLLSTNASDPKRRSQLLSRARAALETELGRRRSGMGLHKRSRAGAKVGGMAEVVGGEGGVGAASLLGRLKSFLGISGGAGGSGGVTAGDAEEEEEEESLDYVDWATLQRLQEGGGSAGAFSLERLDEDVVDGGRFQFGIASVGKERSWDARQVEEEKEGEGEGKWDGKKELVEWLAGL